MANQPASDKLILIIDDDKDVRDLIQLLLQREGFRSEPAADGAEGLQKARTLRPDLILLDLMLPKANGLEIVRELQMDETSDIPIVIMTGRSMDRTTAEMIRCESNVKEYLEKPLKTMQLGILLHRLLNTRPPEKKA